MRSTPFRSLVVGALALALGLPGGALAAPSGKSAKPATKDPSKGTKAEKAEKDPGDPSVPPPEHDGPPRVGRVFVDASGLGDAGPVIGGRATLTGKGALQGQGVTYTDAPAGPELQVTLKERDAGGYRVDYVIVYDGKPTKNGSGGFDCQLCTEDELVEKVEALVIQVAPKMVVPEEEPEDGPGEGPGDDVKDPDGGNGRDPDHGNDPDPIVDDDPGLRGMGKAGVGLLVVGGAGMLGGVVLLVIPPVPVKDDPALARDTKPLGGLVLGVGAAAVIAGVALLVVDRKRAKKGKATALMHPWIGPSGGGIGVTGRF